MRRKMDKYKVVIGAVFCLVLFLSFDSFARDTDIYQPYGNKNNAYMLLDNSGSMSYGVYEHTIDYGEMFDYFFTLNDEPDGDYRDYMYDTVNNSDVFYQNHQEKQKIYLWKGNIGVTIAHVDGEDIAFTGDAADPVYIWYMSQLVDTHTLIDDNGSLSDDGTGNQRVTVDSDGYILLDGVRLPLGLDIKLHDLQTLYNGSVVDRGFGGLMNAPGYYFSGYEGVTTDNLDIAEDGDSDIFFFVIGNWVNMQAMYNLYYTTNSGLPSGAKEGDMGWVYEKFPILNESWPQVAYSLKYPDSSNGDPVDNGDYIANLTEAETSRTINQLGATRMQVHFSTLDMGAGDHVAIYDGSGNQIALYTNTPADGWSAEIPGDTAVIKLQSDDSENGAGYEIDKLRVIYYENSEYLMQSRLDVAKEAMSYVAVEFSDKINWGFAHFGKDADGADIKSTVNFNPNDNDDTSGNELLNHIAQVEAGGGTPLGEALQDLYIDGYYQHSDAIDNHSCRKNFIIAMTDGFPSYDTDWSRIKDGSTTITIEDWDNDGWTNDPYQYSEPPADYYDDVAHWLYTHSWLKADNFAEVSDPANSYENIITHHISFGAYHPLLADAAGESGGEYISTYDKEQLISAFHSLALMISEAVAFTAPVVSIDTANKIQNGDDLYMGLFLPRSDGPWVGNLKKFRLGDESTDRPELWMIYDGDNNEAIDSTGQFLDDTAAFWADDTDDNDNDNQSAADIQEDGAGEVLSERVAATFNSGSNFWEREIYTYKGGSIVPFNRDNIDANDLDVANDNERDKLVNYVYGYTYDADSSGNPVGARSWALGAIVHSRPVVIDYYDTSDDTLPLNKRYIAVGANDGMLHIFNEADGKEVFAFIPAEVLPKLKNIPNSTEFYETVDGEVTVFRRDGNPKYLIFGLRRGGGSYTCLDIEDEDPANWSVKWIYTNSEIKQSWSAANTASILTNVDSDGTRTYKDVVIFTGGYDPEEDNYPEPFNDINVDGTPFDANGNILDTGSSAEWDKNDPEQDVNGNNQYDIYNPDMNEYGRGIFIVDIDDASPVFSVTYGETDVLTGTEQKLSAMKFSFPASPSVVRSVDIYGGTTKFQGNVFRQLYASDIYGNIFKVAYVVVDDENFDWQVRKVFSANPGSQSISGYFKQGEDTADAGRKSFYSPAVSWGGSGTYFDRGNYYYSDTDFDGTDRIATLFFGTGNRERPFIAIVKNRLYSVYDDSAVTAKQGEEPNITDITVSTAPYTEDDLLNLTADELGDETTITSCYLGSLEGECDASGDITQQMQAYLRKVLTDDATYVDSSDEYQLEDGAENDAKGWYIVLEDQSNPPAHVDYPTEFDTDNDSSRDNHQGEKILSQPIVYYNNVYFTSYQPVYDDPCNPDGNGYVYSLDYRDASAALNLNTGNGDTIDITDRYRKYTAITGIPSGFEVFHREGEVGAMAAMGGSLVGPGEDDGTSGIPGAGGFQIPSPGLGLELYYWREGAFK